MYNFFINESMKITIDSTLNLLDNLPKLPLKLPETREELLKIQDIYMQELIEYASILQSKLDTMQGALDKWDKMYTGLTVKQRTEADEVYKEVMADKRGLCKTFERAKDKMALVKARMEITQKVLDKLVPPETKIVSEIIQQPAISKVKLPELPFITFDGNIAEWPRFWNSFQRIISNQELNDADKLSYLVGALKGNPAKLVAGYMIKEENFGPVVNILKETYGQSDIIMSHLRKKLREIPPMRSENELWDKLMAIEEILQQLESSGENVNDANTELMIEEKLPYDTLKQVYMAKETEIGWNVTKLRTFLRKYAINREKIVQILQRTSGKDSKTVRFGNLKSSYRESKPLATSAFNCAGSSKTRLEDRDSFKRNLDQDKRKSEEKYLMKKCAFCNGDHFHNKCTVHSSVKDRLKRIKELSLCARCLRKGHVAKECKANIRACYYCGKLHHSALCEEVQKKERVRETSTHMVVNVDRKFESSSQSDVAIAALPMSKKNSQEILLMCKEVELSNSIDPTLRRKVLVFLDPGSQRSYVDVKLAEELKLPVKAQKKLLLATFAEKIPKKIQTKTVVGDIELEGGGKKSVELETINYLTHKLQIASTPPWELLQNNETRKLLKFTQWKKPEILLGMDYFFQLVRNFKRTISGYYIIDTLIGPIVAGSGQMNNMYEVKKTAQYSIVDVDEFWELETIGIQKEEQAIGDSMALKLFENNIKKDFEGRYEVAWPWKSNTPELSNNYWLCYGRLKSVLNRLQSQPQLLKQYNEIFQEQLRLGIIELAPNNNNNNSLTLEYFLPHQPVITPNKDTTKLRIVFDASAKTKTGKSLNEELHRGPVILPDLVGILLRMRMYKWLILADVEKAFLQIGLRDEDRKVTQFLWVKDINKSVNKGNLRIFRFKRIPFGVISSPFLLAAVVQHHLKQFPSLLSHAILENLYVDNVMIGTNDIEFAKSVYLDAKNLFKMAHMNLRNFATNNQVIRKTFKDEDCYSKKIISILGLKWDLEKDYLMIPTHSWPNTILTKRIILKFIASHFDPLGLIAPILLPYKLGCQELWRQKLEWDESVPETLMKGWVDLKKKWQVTEIVIPRMVISSKDISLHVFVDSSNKAYAATVYGRIEENKVVKVALLCSKVRIMPIKKLSIPKAELVAAVIGSRLVKFIHKQLKLRENKIYAWSDSKCAIAWIKKDNLQKLPKFVENRVQEIQSHNISFRYIPSMENPADLATRGTTINELKNSELWWKGPSFLKLSEENWPVSEDDNQIEIVNNVAMEINNNYLPEINIPRSLEIFIDVQRFNNWDRLVRVVRWILLFLKQFKSKNLGLLNIIPEIKDKLIYSKKPLKLQVSEELLPVIGAANELAINLLIRQAQLDIINIDIKKWNLLMDKKGVWRVYDRLSNLPNMPNNPIYLPRKNKITELIVMDEHEKQGHAGVSQTLANLRIQFWIDKGRQTVKQIITRNCMQCRKWRARPFKLPEMAPLPRERIIQSKPFQNTAIDYAGPFMIRTMYGDLIKKWICLFTCLSTRAVHLQSVDGLSTVEFLEAYKRFTARRGCPKTILSDNGTQFLAAADYVKASWRNITAYAPWQGGVYERLIGLMKRSLRQAIGRRLLNEKEWETLVIKTEGLLNNRPICQLNDDTREVLRPIDFLIPNVVMEEDPNKELSKKGEFYIPNTQDQVQKYFVRTENCLNKLWKFWTINYLQHLRERSNQKLKQHHYGVPRVPKVGEIVLLELNETTPRGKWPLAKVVSIPQGKDGRVRTANIKLNTGKIVTRAISQLYPLEIEESLNYSSENLEKVGDPNLEVEKQEKEVEIIEVNKAKKKMRREKTKGKGVNKWSFFLFIILQLFCKAVTGLIAYDCMHPSTKVTTINAREVKPCVVSDQPPRISQKLIQLIQLADSYSVQVQQCKIMLSRTITYCGMHSHSSIVDGGQLTYMLTVGESVCKEIHATKQFRYSGSVLFDDLDTEKMHSRYATIAGSLDREGSCEGGFYSDQYGSWNNVVVVGSFMITLTSYKSEASTTADIIRLRSQLVCKFSKGYCIDVENGETVWQPEATDACSKKRHVVLFEGLANILQEDEGNASIGATFAVTEGQKIFALRTIGKTMTCPFVMYKTEHPKLLIVPHNGNFYFEKKIVEPGALDLLTYMNAKFVFLDKTIGKNLEDLHKHLNYQRCIVERKTLLTQLSLAYLDPIEFAYALTGEAGYTAHIAGEVIHLILCSPVEVVRRSTSRCYSELPITWNNESYFMAPKSRVIQRRGSELPCNVILRPMYQLGGSWYSLSPHISEIGAPLILSPLNSNNFKYETSSELASGGIYNEAEIEKLRVQIMYPNERAAITNVITRGMLNRAPDMQGLSLNSMIDDSIIDKIQKTIWQKLWGGFFNFSLVMSGILGIVMIIQIIKWLLDTIVHGKILFELYGMSAILFTAIWDSLATYFVYKKQRKNHEFEKILISQGSQIENVRENRATSPFMDASLARIVVQDKQQQDGNEIARDTIYYPTIVRYPGYYEPTSTEKQ